MSSNPNVNIFNFGQKMPELSLNQRRKRPRLDFETEEVDIDEQLFVKWNTTDSVPETSVYDKEKFKDLIQQIGKTVVVEDLIHGIKQYTMYSHDHTILILYGYFMDYLEQNPEKLKNKAITVDHLNIIHKYIFDRISSIRNWFPCDRHVSPSKKRDDDDIDDDYESTDSTYQYEETEEDSEEYAEDENDEDNEEEPKHATNESNEHNNISIFSQEDDGFIWDDD
jgi:hypothetical protein